MHLSWREGELKKEIQYYKCRELGIEKKVYLLGLREDTEKNFRFLRFICISIYI